MSAAKVEELQKAQCGDGASSGGGLDVGGQVSDVRMTLILDLSSKVTEQETEIIRLKEQLCKYNVCSDAAGTQSEVTGSSSSKHSDTGSGRRQNLLSTADHNNDTDSVGDRHMMEERLKRTRFDGQSFPPLVSKTTIGKNNVFAVGASQGPVDSVFKSSSSKQEKNGGSYRPHWASSCFDVDDSANEDPGEVSHTRVSDDQDCASVSSDVTTMGDCESPLNFRKGSTLRARHHRRQQQLAEPARRDKQLTTPVD